jgi:hypothetical protein
MEINDVWKNIEFENSTDFNVKKSREELPLEKIKKSVRYNILWGIFILLAYVVLIVFIPDYIIKAGVFIIMIYSAKLIWDTWLLYQQINPLIHADNTLLNELTYHHEMIKNWIRVQEKMGLYMYPISAAFGFLFGGTMGSGLPISELFEKPAFLYFLLGSVVILTPICYYIVKWMNNYIYKKDLEALEKIITNLKGI